MYVFCGTFFFKKSNKLDNPNKKQPNQFFRTTVGVFKTFYQLVSFDKIIPKSQSTYVFFGIYSLIFTISSVYSTGRIYQTNFSDMIFLVFQVMMLTGTGFAMYQIWPNTIHKKLRNKIIKIWWPIAIFYTLVLFSFFFVMINNFANLPFCFSVVNTMLVVLLLGWKLSVPMLIIGYYCATKLYIFQSGNDVLDLAIGSSQFVFMYSLSIIGVVVVFFLKPKQEYIEETEAKVSHLSEKNNNLAHKIDDYSDKLILQEREIARLGETAQRILNNVNHELRLPVGNVVNFSEMLSEGLGKYSEDQLKTLSDEVVQNSNCLSTMILNMLDLATLDAKKIELQKRTVNLSELIEDRAKRGFKLYKENKSLQFKLEIQPEILIKIDPNYIKQTVDNLVINAITYSNEGTITITLQRKKKLVIFTITDNGIGIPSNELYTIFEPFTQGSNTVSSAEGRGVGLALCKAAIEAHDGIISAKSNGKGASFTFILQNTPLA